MTKTPLTVVHFIDSDTFGGCEELVFQLVRNFDRKLWQPILFYYESPGIDRLLRLLNDSRIMVRPVKRITGRNSVVNMRQFIRDLKQADATIFHAHLNWPLACRHGLLAARLAGVRGVVATAHLYSPIAEARFSWLKQRIQAATLHRYIAVSNEVKRRLHQDLRVAEAKVQVVHNGIQLPALEAQVDSSLKRQLTNGKDCPIVFTPARLHSQKGHVHLLEAAVLVPDATFVLAGDGSERSALEALAHKLGVETRVKFLGQRQDVPQLLANCDLFVLPSLFEGLPLSVLEAMAAGKPVVATNIGGTNEAVIQGETGILVPPADPVSLADAIRSMLTDRARADRMAIAGNQRVKNFFSIGSMVAGVTRVYDDLIK